MFCEAIANALSSDRPARGADFLSRVGAEAARPSLYSSVWHCSHCRTTLRLYASVQQIVTGTLHTDCPECGREMDAADEDPKAARRAAPARRPLRGLAPSAFAA